jgi:kumamolisin
MKYKSVQAAAVCAAAVLMTLLLDATAVAQKAASVDHFMRAAQDSEAIEFALTLPLRNQDQLQQEIKDLYDPTTPGFRKFLTVAEFQQKYAPSAADYDALRQFAVSSGLQVVREPPGRIVLDVSGTIGTVSKLFNVQMSWRQSGDGRNYLWSDREATPPARLASLHASAAVLRQKPPIPALRRLTAASQPGPNAGTGPGGSYVPSNIRTAYNLNSIQNGGTPVALYELSTATYTDVGVYASTYGLNNPTLIQKIVDGGGSDIAALEVMLDIELVMAVSNPTSIYIYTGAYSSTANPTAGTGPLDTYIQIANDNLVGAVSSSWYTGCENDIEAATKNAQNSVFAQMAAQGMAMFIAQGDNGAFNVGSGNCVTGLGMGPQVQDPASQPYVTSAGGTTLTTSSTQGYVSESVWSGTGGGVSSFWSIPSYQAGLPVSDNQFSATMRNVPDMSLDADPNTGYYIYCTEDGGWVRNVGGTSAVAPQLAAFWSLVGKGLRARAGFANPTIYALARNPAANQTGFHDVTNGNNGFYNAFSGYDNATGWGSYNAANLYTAIVGRKRAGDIVPILEMLLN